MYAKRGRHAKYLQRRFSADQDQRIGEDIHVQTAGCDMVMYSVDCEIIRAGGRSCERRELVHLCWLINLNL